MGQKIKIVTDKTRTIKVGGVSKIVKISKTNVVKIEGKGVQGATGAPGAPGASGVWGAITGTLSDQIDLKNQQDAQDILIQDNTDAISNIPPPVWGNITGTLSDQVDLKNQQDAQDSAIALNTAKRTYPLADENRLANTSGTNTGDQDISGIGDNANDITTIQETAIFVDPSSPQDVELNWKGNNVEYDALTPSASTIHFILQLQTLLTATVTGDQDVSGGDTEIYTASFTGSATDVTYLWTVTGSIYAVINGSDTGSTVTVDYTIPPTNENITIQCALTSLNAQTSLSPTLAVVLDSAVTQPTDYTNYYDALDPVTTTGIVYGIDPQVSTWTDGATNSDLGQSVTGEQPSYLVGATPYDNGVQMASSSTMDGLTPQAGSFTYIFDLTNDALPIADVLFEAMAGTTKFSLSSTTQITVRSPIVGNSVFTRSSPITIGLRERIALTFDGTNIEVFQDAISLGTFNHSGELFTFNTIGRKTGQGASVTNHRIFNFPRVLTLAELESFNP